MSEPLALLATVWQYGGAAGAVFYLYKLVRYAATSSWPQAVGKVLGSELREKSAGTYENRNTVITARVEYEYEVGGRKFRNDVIDVGGDIWTSFAGRAEAVRRRYSEGSVVGVYYDPGDPQRSFLERSPAALLIAFAGCIAVSVAGALMRR